MNTQQLIQKVNSSCDNLEFSVARKLMEHNLAKLQDFTYYNQLNSDAKALLKHVIRDKDYMKEKGLSRLDMLKINDINKYCYDFDVPMLKRTLKNNLDMLYRPEVQELLSDNSKYILTTMGVLLTGVKQEQGVSAN